MTRCRRFSPCWPMGVNQAVPACCLTRFLGHNRACSARAGNPSRLAAPIQPVRGEPAAGRRRRRRGGRPGGHARARGVLRRLLADVRHRAAVLEGEPLAATAAEAPSHTWDLGSQGCLPTWQSCAHAHTISSAANLCQPPLCLQESRPCLPNGVLSKEFVCAVCLGYKHAPACLERLRPCKGLPRAANNRRWPLLARVTLMPRGHSRDPGCPVLRTCETSRLARSSVASPGLSPARRWWRA